MNLTDHRVVVTGAGRDFGRAVALRFAELGAEVFLAARTQEAAERTRAEILARGDTRAHAFACDLADPASVRAFARAVGERTDRVDVLVNNDARWLAEPDLLSASDEDVVDTLASGATGTVLVTRNLLPLLLASERPDIVTMVSICGVPNASHPTAHEAYHAAKHAQAGFTESLSRRLRPRGVRVISLFPPDFDTPDILSPEWDAAPDGPQDPLTAKSLLDCVTFAIGQPRNCYINAFHFEPA
ncbi:SDR family oxidoreductase [Streptomyces sp. HU2014]|uniref:SDR family oxidoreductase n=1 Tax=Streptomyces sp. HU2014 TaxID=2939414 RepID=UPI00200EAA65|nr:SDR family NAD(P)-dependent oxidoreductase [Streptomyces sp. HU2014]UQI45486.1 SDR family oxidoreductase [Streptomyces sp. HU2014]